MGSELASEVGVAGERSSVEALVSQKKRVGWQGALTVSWGWRSAGVSRGRV